MCPLHTWISRLAWFRLSSSCCLRYLEKGKVLLICVNLWCLGDLCHIDFHLRLRCAMCSCLTADALAGRVLLSMGGSCSCRLAFPSAASLASLSACSLPLTLLWLEIHCIVSLDLMLSASWMKAFTRCRPGAALGLVDDVRIVNWLSMYSEILLKSLPLRSTLTLD